jgi:hypothetical protein
MSRKSLSASIRKSYSDAGVRFFYPARVTAEELWRRVGEILLLHRTRRGWDRIDVQRAGGPNYATVEKIELGQIGQVEKLEQTIAALGLDLPGVLRAALDTGGVAMSPEAAQLVSVFTRTTVQGRQALLQVAQALPLVEPEPPASPPPLPEPPPAPEG